MGGGGDDVSAEDGGGDDRVDIKVKNATGSKYDARVSLDDTVRDFKEALSLKCDVPASQQRLIYKGQILKDDHRTLRSYGVEADQTVYLLRSFVPSVPANTVGATDAGNENSSRARSVLSNRALGASGNASRSGGGPLIMRDLMNSPFFVNFVNDTDINHLTWDVVSNNPQMREIIGRNPEFGHLLNDPSTIRQSVEASRNPELMREMTRTNDRAMSNIEASPGGYNVLRRTYQNIQEPLLNATMASNAEFDSSNSLTDLLGPRGGNPTRTASTDSSTANSDSETSPPALNTAPFPRPWSPAPNTSPLPNPWLRTGWQGRLQTRADQSSLGFPEFALTVEDFPLLTPTVHNPAGSRLILDSISRPQLSTESIRSDPQLQRRPDYGALYREIVRAREFFQMASPEILLLFLIVLQTLLSLLGEEQSTRERRETGQTDGGTGSVNNSELQALLNRFSGLGTGSAAVPNRPNVPPEELYAAQLSQLQEMGFFDRYENIQALMNTAGNVNAAVERLLWTSGR